MSSIDFLQIGHGQQSDARMVVERGVTDSQRIELAAVHRHLFYAVYWIHEGRGIHSIDFCDYEIRPDRVFLVRPEQVHVMRPEGAMRYSALQFTEEYFHLYAKATPCPTIPGRTGKALVGGVKYPKTILQDSVTIST